MFFQRKNIIFVASSRISQGFPGGSVVKNLLPMQEPQETQVLFLGWDDPLEEGEATHSSVLPWREEPGGL